jgi:hypothetical protein
MSDPGCARIAKGHVFPCCAGCTHTPGVVLVDTEGRFYCYTSDDRKLASSWPAVVLAVIYPRAGTLVVMPGAGEISSFPVARSAEVCENAKRSGVLLLLMTALTLVRIPPPADPRSN